MARELREMLGPKGGRTVRGSAFHASFEPTESLDEGSEAIDTEETEKATPKGRNGRKRSGTQSLETKASKKATPECPACGMRGHSLTECWCIFEELKPQDVKLSAYRVRKAKKVVADDKELKSQVQEIQQKMKKD